MILSMEYGQSGRLLCAKPFTILIRLNSKRSKHLNAESCPSSTFFKTRWPGKLATDHKKVFGGRNYCINSYCWSHLPKIMCLGTSF
jgi:hypothetical protein